MIKLIRKHQKKVMAIVSVGLMIAFSLPSALTGPSGINAARGTIGKDKEAVTGLAIERANMEWELLRHSIEINFGNRSAPAAEILSGLLTPQEVESHDEMFYLLIHEAHDLGTTVSADEFNGIVHNMRFDPKRVDMASAREAIADALLIRNAFLRTTDAIKITQPRINQTLGVLRQQISVNLVEFLDQTYLPNTSAPSADDVDKQYTRFRDIDPESNSLHFGYLLPNRVKFQYLEIPRQALEEAVADTITGAEERYFYYHNIDRYQSHSNDTSHELDATLSLGPIPAPTPKPTTRPFESVREEVAADLKKQKSDELMQNIITTLTTTLQADYNAWKQQADPENKHPLAISDDLAARLPPYGSYAYLQMQAALIQQKFNVLPTVGSVAALQSERQLVAAQKLPPAPASQPTSQPAATQATGPLAATVPTTTPTTTTAASPSTSPALLYTEIKSAQHPKSALIPIDLANAKIDTGDQYEAVAFPFYATHLVYPLANEQAIRSSRIHVLSLYEPSMILKDEHSNGWIFRVSEIAVSVRQEKMDVEQRVEDDCRKNKAHEMALADAMDFLSQAAQTGLLNATTQPSTPPSATQASATQTSAATQASATKPAATQSATTRPTYAILHTGLFGISSGAESLAPYHLPNEYDCRVFMQKAFELLTTPCPHDPAHPVGVADIRDAQRVDIVQLDELVPEWTTKTLGFEERYMASRLQYEQRMEFARHWFSFDELKARVSYVPTPSKKPQ